MIEILLPNSEEPGNYTSHQRTSEEFDEVGEIQAALAD